MSLVRGLLASDASPAVLLVRLSVGSIFLSEGIQKFLYAATLGAGRFAKIGIPMPSVMGPFVGVVEIVCGALVIAGLLTRPAAALLVVDMLVAMVSTKIPIWLGHGFWGFAAPRTAQHGFWSMAHEARTDWAMLLGSAFLVLVGAGAWSLDARLSASRRQTLWQQPRDQPGR
jgi:putative oxidoreductase